MLKNGHVVDFDYQSQMLDVTLPFNRKREAKDQKQVIDPKNYSNIVIDVNLTQDEYQ